MAKMRLAVVLAFAASPTAAWSPISSGLFVRRSTTLWAKIGTIFGTSSGSTEVRAVPRLVIKNIFASESSCSSEIYCLIFENLTCTHQDVADMIAEAFGEDAAAPVNIDGAQMRAFHALLGRKILIRKRYLFCTS